MVGLLGAARAVGRWFGPVFGKELRVSSRRWHTFVVRAAYPLLLAGLLVLGWLATGAWRPRGPSTSLSKMAEVGQVFVAILMWFQFVALHLLALALPSTAIGDEVRRKTLGVLISTPMTSAQIVVGKLLGHLLQLWLLVALGLPVLIVVRVFGGVPAEYLFGGLALTGSTVLLTASLSLLFSIRQTHAYMVVVKTLLVLAVPYGLVPLLWWSLMNQRVQAVLPLFAMNPYALLAGMTELLFNAGAPWFAWVAGWPVACLLQVGAAGLVLMLAAVRVRQAAMRLLGADEPGRTWRLGRRCRAASAAARSKARIRRVSGSPVLWYQMRRRLWSRRRTIFLGGVVLGALAISYARFGSELHDADVQFFYSLVLMGLGVLVTAARAASSLTAEKESGTWPLLLATPIEGWRIVAAKAVGVVYGVLWVWALLLLHLAYAAAAGYLMPKILFQAAIVQAGMMTLVVGASMLAGAIFRKTTTAVVASVGLYALLWLALPMLLFGIAESPASFSRPFRHIAGWTLLPHPAHQISVIINHAAGGCLLNGKPAYFWDASLEWCGDVATMVALLAGMAAHQAAGLAGLVLAGLLVRCRGR